MRMAVDLVRLRGEKDRDEAVIRVVHSHVFLQTETLGHDVDVSFTVDDRHSQESKYKRLFKVFAQDLVESRIWMGEKKGDQQWRHLSSCMRVFFLSDVMLLCSRDRVICTI